MSIMRRLDPLEISPCTTLTKFGDPFKQKFDPSCKTTWQAKIKRLFLWTRDPLLRSAAASAITPDNYLRLQRQQRTFRWRIRTKSWIENCLYRTKSRCLGSISLILPNLIPPLSINMPTICRPRAIKYLLSQMLIMSVCYWSLLCAFCSVWERCSPASKLRLSYFEGWNLHIHSFSFSLKSDDNNEEGFGSFLDEFAVNVFLPQIEEKVMQLIQHATVGKRHGLLYLYRMNNSCFSLYNKRFGCFPRCSWL